MTEPLKPLLESHYYWNSSAFDLFMYSKYFFITFGLLFFFGRFTDKFGIRLTGLISTILMIIGSWLTVYAFSPFFNNEGIGYNFISKIFGNYPPSVVVAFIGFSCFGLGAEITSIVSIKALTKWFSGKEIGFAIGFLIAGSRLGNALAAMLSADFAGFREVFGLPHGNLLFPVYFGAALIFLGFLTFMTFSLFDSNYDLQNKDKAIIESSDTKKGKQSQFSFSNKEFLSYTLIFVVIYLLFSFANGKIQSIGFQLIDSDYSSYSYIIKLFGIILLAPISGFFIDKMKDILPLLFVNFAVFFISLLIIMFSSSGSIIHLIAFSLLIFAFATISVGVIVKITKLITYKTLAAALAVMFWIQTIFMLIRFAV
jgi:MFS family permease